MPSHARETFWSSLIHVQHLVDIHGQLQSGPGRRHNKEAIHRAGVVMSVAAWDGYVENVVMECFTKLLAAVSVPGTPAWAQLSLRLRQATAAADAKAVSTPNAENVQRLLTQTLGFDPWPTWTWTTTHGLTTADAARKTMNQWLKVRHAIAHGSALPSDQSFSWLKNGAGQTRLTLKLMKDCKEFFTRVVEAMDAALGRFLVSHYGIAAPW